MKNSENPAPLEKSGGAHFAPSLSPGDRLFQRFVLSESDGRGPNSLEEEDNSDDFRQYSPFINGVSISFLPRFKEN